MSRREIILGGGIVRSVDGAVDFARTGVPMSDHCVPDEARQYLQTRSHSAESIRAHNFRFLHGAMAAELYPAATRWARPDARDDAATWSFTPKWAITLPDTNDASYTTTRIEYAISVRGKGKEPAKFLNLAGRETVPYISKSIRRADLTNGRKPISFVEASFKAAAAAARGVICIGVNGHSGAFQPQTPLPKNATAEEARATIKAELHPYLLPGREVALLTDADARSNLQVNHSVVKFMDAAAIGFGCVPVFIELPVGGIDDFFAAGNSLKDFAALPRHALDSEIIRGFRCAHFDTTEIGLADRFVAMHGRDHRHDPKAGKVGEWFSWTPSGYRAGNVEAHRAMRTVVESLKAETAAARGTDQMKARQKFQDASGKNTAINAALALAAKDRALEIDAALFDANQDLIGAQNGIVELSTGELLEPSRELMVTKRLAIPFDPKATAPLWGKFIHRICDGKRDHMNYLQEIAGACLAGRSARQEVFFLHGSGANGKTVFMETLKRALGDYAVSVPSKLLLRQQRGGDSEKATPFLITLHGKRLATCSELNENQPIDEATLKDLAGGDLISARANYGAAFQFRNTARILVSCNHLPVVSGTDPAIWDRLIVVPFLVRIPEAEQDGDLAIKLVDELPGVFRWALTGLHRLMARGFRFEAPLAVRELTNAHRANSDVLGAWLEECAEIDPAHSEMQAEVTKSYTDWAMRNNHMPISAKSLWSKLRERTGTDPIYRGDEGIARARGFKLRRNPVADNIITQQNSEIVRLEKELAALKAGSATPTSTTPSRKKDFQLIKGGKG